MECPECGCGVQQNQSLLLNEILECEECGAQLIVKALSPEVKIEALGEMQEDWGE